ncbi:hypothetical protein Oweho_0874 [Owenweeksia hongkongensis DSM 17368]|uniref:Endonuclease GajA/Old nuclease/RecF-like AAA domain-containing protein n=1 Tax=Owenweeksia hongkongensis (strain DSM 17368 / CIP 108786 / JCM 12287 / NRRL B-23963 / UST20020801) TaxID=926562 RepID=G8R2T0_OWEHD|nr:AAA family ATPase [Owenweeksia hongkongensis]AEV31885.1 hypothetical protein Oweho_0874 [Owenweeksia hongkongensis DSM 17368]
MKILSFRATKVHGYIPIHTEFNDELSIIVGGNGSGKTTAIVLMQAILCPNFKDLLTIPFETLSLTILINKTKYTLGVKSISDALEFRVSSIKEPLIIPTINKENIEYLNYHKKELHDINDQVFAQNQPSKVIDFLKNIQTPVFMGLDRTNDIYRENEDYMFERRSQMAKERKGYINYKRQFKGSLGTSLFETEMLVQEAYRRRSSIEERSHAKLKDEILLSSFEYTTFKGRLTEQNYIERRQMLERRNEIKEVLSKIGYSNERFYKKLESFFDKLEELINQMEKSKDGINIEWLTNQAQIERITKILDIIDESNSNISRAFKPINEFISIVNSFLGDSKKRISIDKVGRLNIIRPDGKTTMIDALSSGERQLVVLFANVIFNGENKFPENVFIIDEPELSLHIRWQERFIEKMLSAGKATQFILATHSPDIIGEYKRSCVRINSSH